jgi:hypothetical protein
MNTHSDIPSTRQVWSNGVFTVAQQDKDRVAVTKHFGSFDEVAVLCGGDFESVLNVLFTGAVVTRVNIQTKVDAQ